MLEEKQEMIAQLTGIKSSKKNYYTELKKTVEQLEKKNLQLEIMNEIMKSIKVDMPLDNILSNMIDKLQMLIDFDHISISLLQNNKLVLVNVYPKDSRCVKIGSTIFEHNSLYWTALNEKKIILQELVGSPIHFYEKKHLAALHLQTILVLPIYSKNKKIGVLCMGRTDQTIWNEDELSFLEQLTDHLAITIENVQLYGEVLHAKQQWEDTFKAVDDMIIVFDKDLHILQYNDAANDFYQIRKKTNLLINEPSLKQLIIDTFNAQKAGYLELNYPDQTICEVYSYPIHNKENNLYGVIAYIKDVTGKRKMEAQLIHSGKLAAIGEMAAGIAHELNSPLTAILGNSQLLLRDFSKEDPVFSLLYDIKKCGDRCKQIIKSLLTFSRQDEYIFEPVSLNEAVSQVLNLIKYQFEKNQIQFHIHLQPDLPLIEGSRTQIEQIIINLLLNAKDALEQTSRQEKAITIKTSYQHNELHLTVKDNGIGIEEERISNIFHPFHTTKKSGTGLGLSVSLGIAKKHGGSIDVISQLNKGSTFTLKLPVQSSQGTEVKM